MPTSPKRAALRLSPTTWVRVALMLVAVAVLIALMRGGIDIGAVHRYAERLDGTTAFVILVVLPLFGFPVSVLHVAAGIRFGVGWGLLLVAISIGLQLLASYAIVHVWHDRFARRLEWLRRRIPPGAHASVAVLAVLMPGAPFAAINYLLPLMGVRLRTYLLCCWPLHVLRSTVTVTLGDQSDKLTPARLTVLVVYALLLGLSSWWVYRRLRKQFEDQPSAEDGRMQPA